MTQIEKFKYKKYFDIEPALLHSLFDENISSEYGNDPPKMLDFVNENSSNESFTEIITKSKDYLVNARKIFASKNFYDNDKLIGKTYSEIEKKTKSILEKYNDINLLIQDTFTKNNQEFYFTSGWSSNKNGHAITSYYNKLNDYSYEFLLFNSGKGIGKYHNYDNKTDKWEVILRTELSINDTLNLFKELTVITHLDESDELSFYNLIKHYFKTNENGIIQSIISEEIKDINMQRSQISGSCTYMSQMYFKLYYLYKINKKNYELYNQEQNIIKSRGIDVLKQILKEGTVKNQHKNFIDLIKNKINQLQNIDKDDKETNKKILQNLYDRYYQDVNNFTNLEYFDENFSDNIKLVEINNDEEEYDNDLLGHLKLCYSFINKILIYTGKFKTEYFNKEKIDTKLYNIIIHYIPKIFNLLENIYNNDRLFKGKQIIKSLNYLLKISSLSYLLLIHNTDTELRHDYKYVNNNNCMAITYMCFLIFHKININQNIINYTNGNCNKNRIHLNKNKSNYMAPEIQYLSSFSNFFVENKDNNYIDILEYYNSILENEDNKSIDNLYNVLRKKINFNFNEKVKEKIKLQRILTNLLLYLLLSISNIKFYGTKHFFYILFLLNDSSDERSDNFGKMFNLLSFHSNKIDDNKQNIEKLDRITNFYIQGSNSFQSNINKNIGEKLKVDNYNFSYKSFEDIEGYAELNKKMNQDENRVYHNIKLIAEHINNDTLNDLNLYLENFSFDFISNYFIFNTKCDDDRINVKLGDQYHINVYNGYNNMKKIIDEIDLEKIKKNKLFLTKNSLLYLNYLFHFYDYNKLDDWIKLTHHILIEKLETIKDNNHELLLDITEFLNNKNILLAKKIIIKNEEIVDKSKLGIVYETDDYKKYNIIKLYYSLFLIKYNKNTINYKIIETKEKIFLKKNELDLNEYKLIKKEISKKDSKYIIDGNIITINEIEYLLNINTENKVINKYIKNQLIKIIKKGNDQNYICTFKNANYNAELIYGKSKIYIFIDIDDNINDLTLINYDNNLFPYDEELDYEFKNNEKDKFCSNVIKHKLLRYLSNDDGLLIFKNKDYTLYELFGYKNNNNNLCILFDNNTKKYFYLENKKKIEILTESNGMFNRWIYNLPGSFILKDKNKYYILYPNLNISNYIVPGSTSLFDIMSMQNKSRIFNENTDLNYICEFWSDLKVFQAQKKFRKEIKTEYHLVELNYNGCKLKFTNKNEIENYILLCIFYSKTDCLNSCFDEFLNYTNKGNIKNKVLKNCVRRGEYNNPFNKFFDYKFKNQSKNTDLINVSYNSLAYAKIIQYDLYPSKYSIFNYDSKNNTFVKNKFKFVDINWKLSKDFNVMKEKYIDKQELNDMEKQKIDDCQLSYNDETKKNFKGDYYKCLLKKEFDEDLKINEENKNRILNDIFSKDILSDEKIIDKIFDDIENYQKLLNINLIYNFKIDINNKKVGSNIQKYYNNINEEIIYQGKKTSNIILFEILFGFYIRDEQFKIYQDIIDCINGTNKNYKVYQLLMGKGKTSVIVPLVSSYFVLYKEKFKNMFLLMPSHLIKQTYDDFIQKYITLLDDSNIEKLDYIKRYKENQNVSYLDAFNDKYFEWKIQGTIYKKKIINNNVIIIDDVNIKTLLLNKVLIKDQYIKKKYMDTLDIIRERSVIIIDEFDLLYNPLTSELNFPNIKYTIDSKEQTFSINSHIYEYIVDKLFELYTNNNFEVLKYSESLINKFNNDKYNNDPQFIEMKKTLTYCLYHIFKLHYGFPTKESHVNQFSAVPYNAVNDPVKLSNFSDPDINIILTTLTYIYNDEIRLYDFKRIMIKIHELKNLKDYIKKFNYYSDLSKILDMNIDYLMEYPLDEENLETLVDKFNKNEKTKLKKDFIFNYLKTQVIPKLTYSNEFKNCSFIDIIGSSFSKYKCGFSGTVNINLPRYQNSESCLKYEFCSISESIEDQLSTDIGLLGCLNKKNNIYKKNTTDIFNIIHLYDSLIDSGAFLLEFKSIEVINKIKEILIEKKYFIFIDENDTKMYYNRVTNDLLQYQNQVFDQKDVFIYYDNKHIVGIDIKQPSELKGIVTVSKFNRTTDIAQASYRLRNINYGHEVDFFISDEIEFKINNKKDLLNFLNKKENNMKEDSRYRLNLQNLKYLIRKNDVDDYSNYNDYKFDKYEKSFQEYISEIFIKNKNYDQYENGRLIYKIISELENENNLMDRNQEQEQEKQSEQEKEKDKHLIKNLSILKPRNIQCSIKPYEYQEYVLSDYLNIIDGKINKITDNIYCSPYFSFKEYNMYNNENEENEFEYYSLKKYLMNIHNFYYIKNKNDNKYLIISPLELFLILNISRNNKIDRKIIIKNKNGLIVKELYNEEIVDNIDNHELFIQLLLGKDLNYSEYLQLFDKLFIKDKTKYIDLLNNFSDCFGVKYYNYFMIKMIKENTDLNEMIKKLNSMDNDKFFTTLIGNELRNLNNNKIVSEIKTKIIEEIYSKKGTQLQGGFDDYYKLKYYKYKNKYLKLKENLK